MNEGRSAVKPKSWALRAAGWLALAGALIAFSGLAPACSRQEGAGAFREYAIGAMEGFRLANADAPILPAGPLQGLDAAPRAMPRGEATLVNFWATWCAPCIEEMPTLARLAEDYGDRGLVVAAVSVDREAAPAAAMLDKLSGGALDFYHDPRLAFAFAVDSNRGFPTTILYDREGREIGRMLGSADWTSPEARALIEAALANAGGASP